MFKVCSTKSSQGFISGFAGFAVRVFCYNHSHKNWEEKKIKERLREKKLFWIISGCFFSWISCSCFDFVLPFPSSMKFDAQYDVNAIHVHNHQFDYDIIFRNTNLLCIYHVLFERVYTNFFCGDQRGNIQGNMSCYSLANIHSFTQFLCLISFALSFSSWCYFL